MNCLNCKSKKLKNILDLGKSPISNLLLKEKKKTKEYNLAIVFCEKCNLVQQKKIVNEKKIFSNDYPYLSSISKTWKNHCLNSANKLIKKFNLNSNDLVMEIASNDGTYLEFFAAKKIKTLGIEPASAPYRISISKGIDTHKNYFNYKFSNKLKKNKPKLILANNVIAHVPNLNSFLKGVRNIIENNVFICEFPYLENLIRKNLIDTIYHEHYFYHSINTMQKILNQNDLEAYDFDKISTHGGSIRLYIKKRNNLNFRIRSKLIKIQKKEVISKLNSFENIKKLDQQAKNLKKKLRTFFEKIKKNKLKLIGYGAAAKSVTMIKFMNIQSEVMPFIIDKSKTKINKYIPNTNIKIKGFNFLKEYKPDYILVFVWNINKEIVSSIKKVKGIKPKIFTIIPKLKFNK